MMNNQIVYPLVEYARSIGKNTAEFTASDMAKFTKWWMSQPQRKDMIMMIQKQQKRAGQVFETLRDREIAEEVALEFEEVYNSVHPEEKTVCSMELTQIDVDALLWALHEIFENYDLTGTAHDLALKGLQEGLEGV